MKIELFADILIENCQSLSEMRCEGCPLPHDKYSQLSDFVQILVFNCYSKTYHRSESGDIKPDQFFECYLSHLTFFIHIVDRVALSNLEDNLRHILMSELGEFAIMLSINTLYPDLGEEDANGLFVDCMGHMNNNVREYEQYEKVIEADGEGVKKTLLWEFSKQMAALAGSQNNPGAIMGEYWALAVTLKNLNIESFVESMI